jgi:predicted metalloenzyme YecM
MDSIEKKTIKRKSIIDVNIKIINGEILEFIIYNIEKFKMKCEINVVKVNEPKFNEKVLLDLKELQDDIVNRIVLKLKINKLFKTDKQKLLEIYEKMSQIIVNNRII